MITANYDTVFNRLYELFLSDQKQENLLADYYEKYHTFYPLSETFTQPRSYMILVFTSKIDEQSLTLKPPEKSHKENVNSAKRFWLAALIMFISSSFAIVIKRIHDVTDEEIRACLLLNFTVSN